MDHVVPQRCAVVDDLHGSAAEHIGGSHQHRITQPFGDSEGLVVGAGDAVVGLLDREPFDQSGKPLAVLGQIDAVG
jgi:hypothetical protein